MKLALIAVVGFMGSSCFASSPCAKTVKNIFGTKADDQKRNKLKRLDGTFIVENSPNGLQRVCQFLKQIDFNEVAKMAGGTDRASMLAAAKQFKMGQLAKIFPLASSNLTVDERKELVENVTHPSFSEQWHNTNAWEKGYQALPNYMPPVYAISVEDKGDTPPAPTNQNNQQKSSFLSKMLFGSMIGGGILWFIYENWVKPQSKENAKPTQ